MGLPSIVIGILLNDISTVLDGLVSESKGWFKLVNKSRENRRDRRIEDNFTDPKSSLRVWVGLA